MKNSILKQIVVILLTVGILIFVKKYADLNHQLAYGFLGGVLYSLLSDACEEPNKPNLK